MREVSDTDAVKGMSNLFSHIPKQIDVEIFEALLNDAPVRLERILSKGQSTPAGQWFDQDRNEWVLLLRGEAGLLFEGEPEITVMQPGDYVLIPAHKRHRVEWTSTSEATVWLALHY